jgi:hypothetical protein
VSLDPYQNKSSINDLNAFSNLPGVRISVLKKKQTDQIQANMEESQTYSLLNGVKNIEPSDSRSGFTHHGNYKHLGATEYTLEERPIRNMPSNIKLDPDL